AVGDGVAQLLADREDLAHHGVDDGLARVARADAADLFLVRDDIVEERLQHAAALGVRSGAPAWLGAAGAGDAPADFVAGGGRHVAELLQRRRVTTRQRLGQRRAGQGHPLYRFHPRSSGARCVAQTTTLRRALDTVRHRLALHTLEAGLQLGDERVRLARGHA